MMMNNPVRILMLFLLAAVFLTFGSAALAAVDTCNTDPQFQFQMDGLLTRIVEQIQGILDVAYQALYDGILASNFLQAVRAAMVLYVTIFGLLYMLGIVQLTVGEAAKRVIKIALVAIIVGPGGFDFFSHYAYGLFREGTDELIGIMSTTMAAAMGPGDWTTQNLTTEIPGPFTSIDAFIMNLFNPGKLAIFQAAMATPPYGWAYSAIFGFACLYLLQAVARALWIYIMALLATTLLFGLAPIFIAFIMFDRTRGLFDGWLSQLVNFSLQPILLFTFLGFFAILMDQSMETIFGIQVCYTDAGTIEGGDYEIRYWRFTDEGGNPLSVRWGFEGPICNNGQACPNMGVFPIDIVDLLTFFLIAYIASNFYEYVVRLSNDLAGAYIRLEEGSPVTQALTGIGSGLSRAAGAAVGGGDVLGALFNVQSKPPETQARAPIGADKGFQPQDNTVGVRDKGMSPADKDPTDPTQGGTPRAAP